eukprot:1388676-Rhodomonas_salina.2
MLTLSCHACLSCRVRHLKQREPDSPIPYAPTCVVGNNSSGEISLPPTMSLSAERLEAEGAYLVENGETMLMWLGKNLPKSFLQQVRCLANGSRDGWRDGWSAWELGGG